MHAAHVYDATAQAIAANLTESLAVVRGTLQTRREQLDGVEALWESLPEVAQDSPEGQAVQTTLTRLIVEQCELNEFVATRTTNVINADLVDLGIVPSSAEGVAVHRLVRKLCNITTDEA